MRQFLRSRFLYTVIIFGAISLLAGATKLWQSRPAEYPYRSWTAWAIDDFLQQRQKPGVVFMGSSLVLVPLGGIDANYLNHRIDGALHHKSEYFEKRFGARSGIATNSFNFALPGEMPSDAYMITSFLLKDEKRPDVIVWGVGPRDFMDNLLPSPSATDPYRFLSRFGDVSNVANLMMPEWTERFGYELGRIVYLYGHREDVARHLDYVASTAIRACVPLPLSAKPMTVAEVRQIMPEFKQCDLGPGEAFFRPLSPAEKAQFHDNIEEYRKRYRRLKWDTFRTQMHFFDSALATANERGVKVLVVAMPITDINRSLLSPAALATYKNTVRHVAGERHAAFLDLTDDPRFARSDFGDTVHLHAQGGLRWMDIVVDTMNEDASVLAALKNSRGKNTFAHQQSGRAL